MIRKRLRRMLSRYIGEHDPDISQPAVLPVYINRDTLIIDALQSSKQAKHIFTERNLPACELCPLSSIETIGEAAKNYGINEEEWIMELNFAIFCRLQEMLKVS